jgi:hypothetical protein
MWQRIATVDESRCHKFRQETKRQAWNSVERILPSKRMSGCKFAYQDKIDFFSMLPELSIGSLPLKRP